MNKTLYNTILFCQVWESAEEFKDDFINGPFAGSISDDSCTKLFYLLYAKFGNSPIANNDVEQFKIKLQAVIFQFGPSWEKRLDIQSKLRNLTEDELLLGAKSIHNHSFNPSDEPYTGSIGELPTVNDQNTSTMKRGKLEAYQTLWSLLISDVTGEFINKFKICFKQFVAPEHPVLYESED